MAIFNFKHFSVDDSGCGMKVCTDSVLLGAWAAMPGGKAPERILDLGAGSGLLALMCAQRFPQARIEAVEIDPQACAAADANFAASPWASRLAAVNADALAYKPAQQPDMIISNPPYFTEGLQSACAARATARHGQGLNPFTALDFAAEHLSTDGCIAMVTPADTDVLYHAEMLKLKLRGKCLISTSCSKAPTRALWLLSRADGAIEQSTLAIRDADGRYNEPYMELTKDFYLAF